MSQKRKRSPERAPKTSTSTFPKRKRSPSLESPPQPIFRSNPIHHRASTFIAYYTPTPPTTTQPRSTLQNLPEIESATHKILASREKSPQQSLTPSTTTYKISHDDDGEKHAGARVAKVLENVQVTGVCVVARWYGGVLLGPVRFEHIEGCAREAVAKWREAEAEREGRERDLRERGRLVEGLGERDGSIAVLRVLAREKEVEVGRARERGEGVGGGSEGVGGVVDGSGKGVGEAGGKPAIDYSSMATEKLRTLEKARDATLSFLLKRIDKAEEELVALGEQHSGV